MPLLLRELRCEYTLVDFCPAFVSLYTSVWSSKHNYLMVTIVKIKWSQSHLLLVSPSRFLPLSFQCSDLHSHLHVYFSTVTLHNYP